MTTQAAMPFTDLAQPTEEPMRTELIERPATTPLVILQTAVERGTDASQLEKLMDLQERWEKNQAEKAFNEAMYQCQQQMPAVVKDAQNSHTKTGYATLEAVQKTARPIYAPLGFSLCFGEDDCPRPDWKRTVCDVSHVGGHTRRYHLDLPVDSSGSMNKVQGCISTTSYGQRRLLCMIFNVTIGDEDDDGQTASEVIAPELADELAELIKKKGTSLQRVLDWAKRNSLDEFTVTQYREAKKMLQAK